LAVVSISKQEFSRLEVLLQVQALMNPGSHAFAVAIDDTPACRSSLTNDPPRRAPRPNPSLPRLGHRHLPDNHVLRVAFIVKAPGKGSNG
jgi:hypothetical protein